MQAEAKPTFLTWCADCSKSGMRAPADDFDEECRYCAGRVMVKRYPSRQQAHKAMNKRWRIQRKAAEVKA